MTSAPRPVRYSSNRLEQGYLRLALYRQTHQRCWVDGEQHEWGALEIDHVIPRDGFAERRHALAQKGLAVDFGVDDVENLAVICGYHNGQKSNRSFAATEMQLALAAARAEEVRRSVEAYRRRPESTQVVLNFLALPTDDPAVLENGPLLAQRLADTPPNLAESWTAVQHVQVEWGEGVDLHGMARAPVGPLDVRWASVAAWPPTLHLDRDGRVDDRMLRRKGLTSAGVAREALDVLRNHAEGVAVGQLARRAGEHTGEGDPSATAGDLRVRIDDVDMSALVVSGTIGLSFQYATTLMDAYHATPDGSPLVIPVTVAFRGRFIVRGDGWQDGPIEWRVEAAPTGDLTTG